MNKNINILILLLSVLGFSVSIADSHEMKDEMGMKDKMEMKSEMGMKGKMEMKSEMGMKGKMRMKMKDNAEAQVGIASQDLSNWSIKQILNKANNFLALTRTGYQWRYTEDHINTAKKELMEGDKVLARISAEKAYNEARLAYNQSRKHDAEIETAFPSSK